MRDNACFGGANVVEISVEIKEKSGDGFYCERQQVGL
jgi:hypothetical protein